MNGGTSEPGRIVAANLPYDDCPGEDCTNALRFDSGVFLFRNLNSGKMAFLCRDCATDLELHPNTPWKLVAL